MSHSTSCMIMHQRKLFWRRQLNDCLRLDPSWSAKKRKKQKVGKPPAHSTGPPQRPRAEGLAPAAAPLPSVAARTLHQPQRRTPASVRFLLQTNRVACFLVQVSRVSMCTRARPAGTTSLTAGLSCHRVHTTSQQLIDLRPQR